MNVENLINKQYGGKRDMKRLLSSLLVVTVALSLVMALPLAVQANPGVTIYANDKPGWEAFVGSWKTEDFTDATLNPEITVATVAGHVDVGLGVWSDILDPLTGDTTTWTFNHPIDSFGGMWNPGVPGGAGTGIAISIGGGPWIPVGEIPNTYANQFWGFVSDVPFTGVLLESGTQSGARETYYLDNLVYSGLPGISPSSVAATLGMTTPPSFVVINKIIHTPAIPPKPDIVFLSDTTGSMGAAIANVQANLTSIMNQILADDPSAEFAVAEYKDLEHTTGDLVPDPFNFMLNQAITANPALITAAMATWVTDGYGGDEPEEQLYALDQIATIPAMGFRPGSTRIVVWMGDSPGHDPAMAITEAMATNALNTGANSPIRVIAVPVVTPLTSGLDATGQATRITAATGGLLMPGATPDQVADAIMAGLSNLPITVSMTTNCVAPLGVTFVPASQTVISGSIVIFTETITLASNALPGIYEGDDWVLINGNPMTDSAGNIIKEHKTITARGPDLVITKTDNPDPVIVGTDLTYIITVKNNGPSDATGVVVTDTLPAGVTFKSALPAPGTYNSGTGVWTVGNLANGGTATLNLMVNINAPAVDGTVLTNVVKITGCNPVDPDTTNNEATQTTKVLAPIIKVTKTDSLSGAVNPGDTIKYTTVITNSGNGPATGVIFTDTPDMNTTLVVGSVTTTGGFVTKGNIAGNIVEVNIGTIAALSNVTVTFTVTVNKPLWEPQIVNQGIVKGATIVTLKTNDPDTALSDDPTVTLVKASSPVHGPSMSDWGIVALTVLIGIAMFRVIRRRENRI
jgi:uncharacterized repeat protein (TIGR01451 family)